MTMEDTYTEYDYDILNEIFNIGVGKAADLLSQIVDKRIILRIPRVLMLHSPDEISKVPELAGLIQGTLMVSSISFSEQLSGTANLVFPAGKMRDFIALCAEEEPAAGGDDGTFTDVDFDIVREIGNIFLNCILGSTGDFLKVPMNYSLPVVKVYDENINFSKNVMTKDCPVLLFLSVTFVIDSVKIEGAVLVSLALASCEKLLELLRRIEGDAHES